MFSSSRLLHDKPSLPNCKKVINFSMWVSHCHPKVHMLKPIHALPTSLLGFHPSSLLPLPTSDFQMSSEPSCFRMSLPNPLWRFIWGRMNFVSWLWPAFCSFFTSHLFTITPAPFPVCHMMAEIMVYKHLLWNFPVLPFVQNFPQDLPLFQMNSQNFGWNKVNQS